MSATRKMVNEELAEVEVDEGAGITVHAESEKTMTNVKIATKIHHYPNVIDDEWLHIFSKLDPEAKATFSRVSDDWHDLVALKRPEFLSKEITPILIDTLPKKALLKSRELCRSWTADLNHHLQGDQFQVRLPSEISEDRGTESDEEGPGRLINVFTCAQDIQSFLKDMEGHHGNPFPGGTVELWWDLWKASQNSSNLNRRLGSAREEFWTSAILLLRDFGSHISYFGFHKKNDPVNTRTLVENLRDCFLNLPNLKRLSIHGVFNVYHSSELDVIQDWLTRNPLPLLPNLEMFCTWERSSSNAGSILTNAVLDNCIIIANMKVVFFESNNSWDVNDPSRRLPDQVFNFVNLEVLKTPWDLQDLERLGNLAQRPPLRELILDSKYFLQTPATAHQLFRPLEPFGNTLTHLHVENWLTPNRYHMRWMSTRINLPNLKELSLPDFSGSLDPLIRLSSLTLLRIVNNFSDDDDGTSRQDGSIVEFYGFQKRLYDSNIWQLIPSLESIDIGPFIYQRRYLGRFSGAQNETADPGSSPATSD